jgi:hypothetical protein
VTPWVLSLTRIGPTWLTALMFWVTLAEGAVFTLLTSIALILALRE